MKSQLPKIFLVLLAVGCAGPSPYVPTVPQSVTKRVEMAPLPPDPAEENLPEGVPQGDWVEPVEEGGCVNKDGTVNKNATRPCPDKSGIALSEERAFRDAKYRIRYREMRRMYEADRDVWTAHRELYEERLKLADEAIRDLQPSWWDKHKFSFGVVGGLVLGVAATVGIVSITDGL